MVRVPTGAGFPRDRGHQSSRLRPWTQWDWSRRTSTASGGAGRDGGCDYPATAATTVVVATAG
jgi:hypothetical protein